MTGCPIIRANRRMSPLYIIAADLFSICSALFILNILHVHFIIPTWQFVALPIAFMFLHIAVYYLTWPIEVEISRSGVTLVYNLPNRKFIPWESIEKVKIPSKSYGVKYRKNGKIDYFSLDKDNTRLVKEEWEKWKARRKDA